MSYVKSSGYWCNGHLSLYLCLFLGLIKLHCGFCLKQIIIIHIRNLSYNYNKPAFGVCNDHVSHLGDKWWQSVADRRRRWSPCHYLPESSWWVTISYWVTMMSVLVPLYYHAWYKVKVFSRCACLKVSSVDSIFSKHQNHLGSDWMVYVSCRYKVVVHNSLPRNKREAKTWCNNTCDRLGLKLKLHWSYLNHTPKPPNGTKTSHQQIVKYNGYTIKSKRLQNHYRLPMMKITSNLVKDISWC